MKPRKAVIGPIGSLKNLFLSKQYSIRLNSKQTVTQLGRADRCAVMATKAKLNEITLNGTRLKELLDTPSRFNKLAKQLYNDLDQDNNGYLNKKEILPAIQTLGLEYGLPPQSVIDCSPAFKKMMNETYQVLDADRNGRIDLEEYKVLLREMLKRIGDGLKIQPIVVRIVDDIESAKKNIEENAKR